MFILLQCHGDIEKNPGPRKLNMKITLSMPLEPAHKFSKLTELKAYISMYKHDFI